MELITWKSERNWIKPHSQGDHVPTIRLARSLAPQFRVQTDRQTDTERENKWRRRKRRRRRRGRQNFATRQRPFLRPHKKKSFLLPVATTLSFPFLPIFSLQIQIFLITTTSLLLTWISLVVLFSSALLIH